MKTRWNIILLAALVCMAVPAMAQPAPFAISGQVYDASGNPCNGAWVLIKNMNTSVSWDAENYSTSNYYQLALDSDDVSEGNILQINASGCSQSKTEEHTVTQGEINAGGFSEDITLEGAAKPDLIVNAIPAAYHWLDNVGVRRGDPWFNLTNYVNVTVENIGTESAGGFNVTLYANDTLIGEKRIDGLAPTSRTNVTFEWKPTGSDPMSWNNTPNGSKITYTTTDRTYTLRAAVDEANNVPEANETNNNLTRSQKVVWNGYTGDEPLQNYIRGNVKGGMFYSTGDGAYQGVGAPGAAYGTYYNVTYNLEIPGTPRLSRLYIYYTWAQSPAPPHEAPKIGITLTTSSGTHTLSMDKGYNDYKGEFGVWRYPWGTYAYNISEYVTAGGEYKVSITNLNPLVGSDTAFATKYAFAAPAILTVYENSSMPMREYWINEGADILLGGRRGDGGFLAWWECMNNATFLASSQTMKVVNATLGVVAPWAGTSWQPGTTNHLFFNDVKLGTGVYHDVPYEKTIDGITMHIGSTNAQVGVNVTDVTALYRNNSENVVSQADDGDNMMPANAFLVVEYESQTGTCGDVDGLPGVTTNDGRQIFMYLLYGADRYPVHDLWAADCDGLCDGITTNDGRQIFMNLLYGAERYPLRCCG